MTPTIDTEHNQQTKKHTPIYRRPLIVILCVFGVIGIVVIVASLFIWPVRFQGTSMEPTISDGDRLFISRGVGKIERGDVVVFYFPRDTSKSFIKRVVGLPGEKIDVDEEGHITINGQVLDESYLLPERDKYARDKWRDVRNEWKILAEDQYFILGDNRDASNDSRSFGPVSKKLIYGKVVMRFWPLGGSLK